MMNIAFHKDDRLRIENVNLRKKVEFLMSDEVLVKTKSEHDKELKKKDREIARAERKNSKVQELLNKNRSMLERHKNLLFEKECEIIQLNEIVQELKKQVSALGNEKQEIQEKNQKLTAQMNRDYENSSIPSSQKPNHKLIKNSRVKTERGPGGQPGHQGHGRKKLQPTTIMEIPVTDEMKNNPDLYPTGTIIKKQVTDIHFTVTVTEYQTPEYRNRKSGTRIHAPFPEGIQNDVAYGSNLRALACILNNYCNVSIDKTQELISELTKGIVNISKGMINCLGKEFSINTEQERKKIFANLLQAPVMYSDATNARMNGQGRHVFLCANKNEMLYFLRKHKGHEGLKETPVEEYQQTLVHDHDITYYNYGNHHQECLAHVLRYLQDSIDNETVLTWNIKMKELISEMIHQVKHQPDEMWLSEKEIASFEERYNELLKLAEVEYKAHPPGKYYRDGYNLYLRLGVFKESHLLFLRDRTVDYTNNLAERQLRKFKRKQKQAVTFRSDESISYICDMFGIIETRKMRGEKIFQTMIEIFKHKKTPQLS